MTWFANEILAPAVPSLVDEITAFAGYREAAHVVRTLEPDYFHDEAVRHDLPREGMLVIRPVGDPADLEDWYDEPIIPWLAPPGWELPELAVSPDSAASLFPSAECLPPSDFLRALKGLASRHDTTVAYGYFSTWGGANELEYAWVFGDDEAVLVNATPDACHVVLRDARSPTESREDLLQALCARLGVQLPTPFFALHTTSFRWDDHRIVPARRPASRRLSLT